MVYQATVTTKDSRPAQTYVGLTENSFKTGFANHRLSFRDPNKRLSTELSRHVVKYRLDWICKTWTEFVKHGFVKRGFVKYGFVKHGFVKHGFVKHGFVKGGFVKHGLITGKKINH